MEEVENHFTVFVRLPCKRGDFVDPPPVAWDAAKERALWAIISKQSRSDEIHWKGLAEKFDVTQPFLLQRAAWLYERQLSHVRAQMRKVGTRQSSNPSPVPASMQGSGLGGQPMKRDGSGDSRVPSRLSVLNRDGPFLRGDVSAPGSPNPRSKGPQPLRLGAAAGQSHSPSSSVTDQRRGHKEVLSSPDNAQDRTILSQHQPFTKSPKEVEQSSPSSSDHSEEEQELRRVTGRRSNPSAGRHRPHPLSKHRLHHSDEGGDGEDEEEDSSPLLPFAAGPGNNGHHQSQDPSATLRGGLGSPSPSSRQSVPRRGTMERIDPNELKPAMAQAQQQMNSSASSGSSGPGSSTRPTRLPQSSTSRRTGQSPGSGASMSPRRAAELAATGLSPLRRPGSGREGSDGTPSMGSSFSDLEDASVTQSALEEALISNMQHGRNGSVASRMSTISQALRSRVFDQGGR